MKIGIIGTRGIPNHYGGFEQFAQYLSVGLVQLGHDVTVYNSHKHPYQEKEWQGVQLVHCFDPEFKIGTAGQFIYDLNCIMHARKKSFDIILQLGYTSSSVWSFLFPKKSTVITNMDGLEWKRTKYNKYVQLFLKYAEKLAVNNSHVLVADSIGIQNYLKETYKVDSTYIAYGTELFETPDTACLQGYDLISYNYNLLIARLEPENNIELILDGHVASDATTPFVVIGNYNTSYGNYLKEKYKNKNTILFEGAIYDQQKINNLRYYSNLYFHGHSVGGTNPSLLEAMGCSCLICAHDNVFNKTILTESAFYFSTIADVVELLKNNRNDFLHKIKSNIEKINTIYSWDRIVKQYDELFKSSR